MKKYVLMLLTVCCFSLLVLLENSTTANAAAIEFELVPDNLELTNQEVPINVVTKEEITEAKWCEGKKNVSYFEKNGADVYTSKGENYFVVTKNGDYTVYVKNEKGEEGVRTITIDNIDTTKPTIDYDLDATNRKLGVITLSVEDNVEVAQVLFYYGKLTDPEDERWIYGNIVEDNTFKVYKNGTISVKAVDTVGNARIKYIKISYIKGMNADMNNGMNEKVQVVSYFGILTLNIRSIEEVTLTDNRPAYKVNYYLSNINYGGKKTCFSTNRNFKVYDSDGNELETSCYDFIDTHVVACTVPKYISSGTGAQCSFLVYGTTAPAYLTYTYWDDNLDKSKIKILCQEDYMQTNPDVTATEVIDVAEVTDFALEDGTYTGTVKNALPQGNGVYTYLNGDVYTGELYAGKRNGYGELVNSKTGAIYRGEFLNGKKDGYGSYYDYNGTIYTGWWEDDSFVEGKVLTKKGTTLWHERISN